MAEGGAGAARVGVDVDLSRAGAVLLVLGFPAGGEFGIDFHRWATGPRFRGLRLVPPGVHAVSTSAAPSGGGGAMAELQANHSCFFLHFLPGDVVVRRWSTATEQLEQIDDEDELHRYELGVRRFEFEADLAPYPIEGLGEWQEATGSLTREYLDAIQPVHGTITPSQAPMAAPTAAAAGEAAAAEAEAVPAEGPVLEPNHIFYTPLDLTVHPSGLSPELITMLGMDKSHLLTDIPRLLAEFEYSFLAFFLGHSYESFEQWKKLLHVFCTAQTKLVTSPPEPFEAFLRGLTAQMRRFPEDFFVADMTGGNFLVQLLKGFLELIHDAPHPVMRRQEQQLRTLLEERFGVPLDPDFPDADDEDGPQIVNLGPAAE